MLQRCYQYVGSTKPVAVAKEMLAVALQWQEHEGSAAAEDRQRNQKAMSEL
jgi:hypothetical protein